GRFGYPQVSIGILSPQFSGDMENYASPRLWSTNNTKIDEIAANRYSLVNSKELHGINNLKGRFLEMVQEVGMGKQSEVEIILKKLPKLSLRSEREIIPYGPAADIQKARITANTKIDLKIEKVIRDIDLKSVPALTSLYQKGFEEAALSKLLSVGTLGLKKNRKLVPTRWSITATDDIIGKELICEIKEYPPGEYQAYFGGGWGNYYLLLFFPEVWSYELFETYLSSPVNPWSKQGYRYSTDYESYQGRKSYAEETAGGYYAARISILEKMKQNKRQASCLALRFITSAYNVPLGVWICREAARKSCQSIALEFSSQKLLLQYAQNFIKAKFNFDLNLLLKESRLLKIKKLQTKLTQF
ncbi:MAG TPA: hypothetical protein VJI98_04975, partial [Candidatus Nanoarchaeia archaeon]|nr:hypothetical protein [Candidatus Nanoarchaeia archaeon]